MASDNLNQVGKYIRRAGRVADQALKRTRPLIPDRDRVKDTLSSVYPFKMKVISEGNKRTLIEIKFDKPPPSDCGVGCYSTSCEKFSLFNGGHSIGLTNSYEVGSVTVYLNGDPLSPIQWFEENPGAGQVYVQVPGIGLVVVCYTYITC